MKIRNWDKWQSYRKDRGQPPWIKIHRRLMRDMNWIELSSAERGQLVAIWLLAADHDGVIPASVETIRKLCFIDEELNLQVFVDKGFIEPDAKVTPNGCQSDARVTHQNRIEENREEEKEGANAPYAFKGKIIKLTESDHALWKASFSNLDLTAELVARDAFLAELPEKDRRNWFVSTAALLRNRNQTVGKPKANGPSAAEKLAGEWEVAVPRQLEERQFEISESERIANLKKLDKVLKLKRM